MDDTRPLGSSQVASGAMKDRIVPVVTGPTGVGKTELSIELAQRLGAEIVSVDSRQIYRELTIGSAKPDREQLAAVRHHFIDELSLGQLCSSGRYAVAATKRIHEVMGRGMTPLVVGGSTLYLQALQYGLPDIPDIPPKVRAAVMDRLSAVGPDRLFKELSEVDPKVAASMDPTKTQRLVRALEVYAATGQPLSSFQRLPVEERHFSFRTVVLHRDRTALYERINRRVDGMLSDGLLDEARQILDAGFDPGLNALRTIGYRETIAHLRRELDWTSVPSLIKRNTRRYAKRQLTWFRRFPEYNWASADASPDVILELLYSSESSAFQVT